MSHLTNHLTKLTCAADTARDLGYLHTGRALERLILAEKARLKATIHGGADGHVEAKSRYDRSDA